MTTTRGLVINLHDANEMREEDRIQEPVLHLPDGSPVFEVWYWHEPMHRWFVLTKNHEDARWAQANCVAYSSPEMLRSKLATLGSNG